MSTQPTKPYLAFSQKTPKRFKKPVNRTFNSPLPVYDPCVSQVLRLKKYILDAFEAALQENRTSFVRLPSPAAMALGLRCTTQDVKITLDELKRHGYKYRMTGDRNPVYLWDDLKSF